MRRQSQPGEDGSSILPVCWPGYKTQRTGLGPKLQCHMLLVDANSSGGTISHQRYAQLSRSLQRTRAKHPQQQSQMVITSAAVLVLASYLHGKSMDKADTTSLRKCATSLLSTEMRSSRKLSLVSDRSNNSIYFSTVPIISNGPSKEVHIMIKALSNGRTKTEFLPVADDCVQLKWDSYFSDRSTFKIEKRSFFLRKKRKEI